MGRNVIALSETRQTRNHKINLHYNLFPMVVPSTTHKKFSHCQYHHETNSSALPKLRKSFLSSSPSVTMTFGGENPERIRGSGGHKASSRPTAYVFSLRKQHSRKVECWNRTYKVLQSTSTVQQFPLAMGSKVHSSRTFPNKSFGVWRIITSI